jgi:hypothetical protein
MKYLAFFVSSAMWPDASKPVMVPAVNKLRWNVKAITLTRNEAYKDRIQFHPAGAPVPLSEKKLSRVRVWTTQELLKRTSLCKNVLGRAEAVGLRYSNGEPDDAEEEIEHHEED